MKIFDSPPAHAAALIEDAAVDWAIRRASGLTAVETAELLRWLAADARHAAALNDAEMAAGVLGWARKTGAAGIVLHELRRRQDARRTRRRVVALGAFAFAAAAAVFTLILPEFRRTAPSPLPMQSETTVVRPDRQTLPDGSVVHLNAGSEIRVAFTAGRRNVELLRGEALFSVVSDPARPFVVAAAGVEVRAVGTEFSVRRGAAVVDVLVTEGRVAVARTIAAPPTTEPASNPVAAKEPVYLAAGNRVSLRVPDVIAAPISVRQVTPGEISDSLAWRDKRIEFSGTTLGEAVKLFNVVNRTQVVLSDPTLAGLRIGGVFWKDDPEAFATLLEMSLNLRAERSAPHRIVLCRVE